MKDLRTLLEASMLSDIETTLSAGDNDVKTVLNGTVPNIKDFHHISIWEGVEWECPLLIKKFAKDVEKVMQKYNNNYIAENIIGMRCMYREALGRAQLIFGLYLYDKNGQSFCIRGIGSTTERISPMNAKKLILKFIKYVCDDYDILDTIAEIHNTSTGSVANWFQNAIDFKDFVKNL
jgi:hypothetical protein